MPNVDFRSLLDDTSETVQRPKSAPESWLIATVGQSSCDTTRGEKETPFIAFELGNIEPHPQNPQEILDELAKIDLGRLRSPYRRGLTAEFWLTPDAKYRLTDMLDRVVGGKNRTIKERVPEMTNQRVQFKVRPDRDNEGNDTGQNRVLSDTLTLATI
jgi:hypothetical protein